MMGHDDPTLDEIRAIRREISEQVGHDPARLVAYYMALQERYRDRLIERPEAPIPDDADRAEAAIRGR